MNSDPSHVMSSEALVGRRKGVPPHERRHALDALLRHLRRPTRAVLPSVVPWDAHSVASAFGTEVLSVLQLAGLG